jgi:hypothetical protein
MSSSSSKLQTSTITEKDFNNCLFLQRLPLNSLTVAVNGLVNPIANVSEVSRRHLSTKQRLAIERSFLSRTAGLKAHLADLKKEFTNIRNIEGLLLFRTNLQSVRDHYFNTEQVFEYYVDLLHTRSERFTLPTNSSSPSASGDMGMLLRGCDQIAYASLSQGLLPLGHEIPTVICYQDRGEGASILKAGIMLWDSNRNPAAVIKVVRSAIPLPRLTSILHECGHQVAHITNWNQELGELLYNSILAAGGPKYLAHIWESWASELAGDFFSLHQSSIASILGLYEVVAGSAIRIARIIPGDPHPPGILRLMVGIQALKIVYGSTGPWHDLDRVLRILYPINAGGAEASKVITDSIALLPAICKAISGTKMKAFSGKSLDMLLPWDSVSPKTLKKFLKKDFSNFSVDAKMLVNHPIVALLGFRLIQMFGGRSHYWIIEQMHKWLVSLALGGGGGAKTA